MRSQKARRTRFGSMPRTCHHVHLFATDDDFSKDTDDLSLSLSRARRSRTPLAHAARARRSCTPLVHAARARRSRLESPRVPEHLGGGSFRVPSRRRGGWPFLTRRFAGSPGAGEVSRQVQTKGGNLWDSGYMRMRTLPIHLPTYTPHILPPCLPTSLP